MNKNRTLTESDIDYLEKRFKGVFSTKKELFKVKSDLIDHLDAILKEVIASF